MNLNRTSNSPETGVGHPTRTVAAREQPAWSASRSSPQPNREVCARPGMGACHPPSSHSHEGPPPCDTSVAESSASAGATWSSVGVSTSPGSQVWGSPPRTRPQSESDAGSTTGGVVVGIGGLAAAGAGAAASSRTAGLFEDLLVVPTRSLSECGRHGLARASTMTSAPLSAPPGCPLAAAYAPAVALPTPLHECSARETDPLSVSARNLSSASTVAPAPTAATNDDDRPPCESVGRAGSEPTSRAPQLHDGMDMYSVVPLVRVPVSAPSLPHPAHYASLGEHAERQRAAQPPWPWSLSPRPERVAERGGDGVPCLPTRWSRAWSGAATPQGSPAAPRSARVHGDAVAASKEQLLLALREAPVVTPTTTVIATATTTATTTPTTTTPRPPFSSAIPGGTPGGSYYSMYHALNDGGAGGDVASPTGSSSATDVASGRPSAVDVLRVFLAEPAAAGSGRNVTQPSPPSGRPPSPLRLPSPPRGSLSMGAAAAVAAAATPATADLGFGTTNRDGQPFTTLSARLAHRPLTHTEELESARVEARRHWQLHVPLTMSTAPCVTAVAGHTSFAASPTQASEGSSGPQPSMRSSNSATCELSAAGHPPRSRATTTAPTCTRVVALTQAARPRLCRGCNGTPMAACGGSSSSGGAPRPRETQRSARLGLPRVPSTSTVTGLDEVLSECQFLSVADVVAAVTCTDEDDLQQARAHVVAQQQQQQQQQLRRSGPTPAALPPGVVESAPYVGTSAFSGPSSPLTSTSHGPALSAGRPTTPLSMPTLGPAELLSASDAVALAAAMADVALLRRRSTGSPTCGAVTDSTSTLTATRAPAPPPLQPLLSSPSRAAWAPAPLGFAARCSDVCTTGTAAAAAATTRPLLPRTESHLSLCSDVPQGSPWMAAVSLSAARPARARTPCSTGAESSAGSPRGGGAGAGDVLAASTVLARTPGSRVVQAVPVFPTVPAHYDRLEHKVCGLSAIYDEDDGGAGAELPLRSMRAVGSDSHSTGPASPTAPTSLCSFPHPTSRLLPAAAAGGVTPVSAGAATPRRPHALWHGMSHPSSDLRSSGCASPVECRGPYAAAVATTSGRPATTLAWAGPSCEPARRPRARSCAASVGRGRVAGDAATVEVVTVESRDPELRLFVTRRYGGGLAQLRLDGRPMAFSAPPSDRHGPPCGAAVTEVVQCTGLASELAPTSELVRWAAETHRLTQYLRPSTDTELTT